MDFGCFLVQALLTGVEDDQDVFETSELFIQCHYICEDGLRVSGHGSQDDSLE